MTAAWPARPRRARDEGGSALVELTWLSILLLVPLVYLMLTVFDVQRSAFGVSGAARAAGRAYTQAPSEASAMARARAAAEVTLRDHDVEPGRVRLSVRCRPHPGNCLAPGSVVHVDLSYQVPLPLVPSALGSQSPSVRVSATHAVAYGPFREDR